ncbi:MAG: pyruvate, phosphate dikinase [Sandaracinaceae bacterium]
MTRWVYSFGDDIGDATPKKLLGGKGAGLSEMTRMGIPVPPGFTISTEACLAFRDTGGRMPDGLKEQVDEALARLEETMGRKLGDPDKPLLVSVRSGAMFSMPGMMDTVLNLGLNDRTVEGLAASSEDRRFAFDAYRRLTEMFGNVVLGVSRDLFEDAFHDAKAALGNRTMGDTEVPAEALAGLVKVNRKIITEAGAEPFPDDAREQLWGAIRAVFQSWDNPRAKRYRRIEEIPDDLGTAVNIQAMVFGNMGESSGSGVAFTRSPSTGNKALYGEFLQNAQGEDVVAGTRTPQPLTVAAAGRGQEGKALERTMPEIFQQLAEYATTLENHFRDVQDLEFTIENGRLYLLQTRNGKRTAHAAVKTAGDMVQEGLITKEEGLLRVDAKALDQLLHARLPKPGELAARGIRPLATGLPASPGAASGEIVFEADEAERLAAEGRDVILVRRETSAEDIHGMKAAKGILTATGGMTSHAAVVARGLGTCCVAGVSALTVDYLEEKVTARGSGGGEVLGKGDTISLDGTHGAVYRGELDVEAATQIPELETLMSWADEARRLGIRTNADTPTQARTARSYGAQGIGLCRTEHMFFSDERLEAVRAMVLAESEAEQARWLEVLEPMQRGDFEGIFEAMAGLPVTIRLLDWPLHEFLPREDEEFDALGRTLKRDPAIIRSRARGMHEQNPMLGHRGVRLGLTRPMIYRMQVRAMVEAALATRKRGHEVALEIMIPVVSLSAEVAAMKAEVRDAARSVLEAAGESLDYKVGTMIELPRACLVADQIAEHAEFFSFGTNDLTQTTYGISRDDAGTFIGAYQDDPRGLLAADPFARLDEESVGELVKLAVAKGRSIRADLKVGLCGEHGGDPTSVDFCHRAGLDYVSCSPPRLPIARLAAAQAAVRQRQG